MGEGVKNFQKLIRAIYITVLYSYWIYMWVMSVPLFEMG